MQETGTWIEKQGRLDAYAANSYGRNAANRVPIDNQTIAKNEPR